MTVLADPPAYLTTDTGQIPVPYLDELPTRPIPKVTTRVQVRITPPRPRVSREWRDLLAAPWPDPEPERTRPVWWEQAAQWLMLGAALGATALLLVVSVVTWR